jgi:hypothetical protein
MTPPVDPGVARPGPREVGTDVVLDGAAVCARADPVAIASAIIAVTDNLTMLTSKKFTSVKVARETIFSIGRTEGRQARKLLTNRWATGTHMASADRGVYQLAQ